MILNNYVFLTLAGSQTKNFYYSLDGWFQNNLDVYNLIEQFRIGNLHPDDVGDKDSGQDDTNDPWAQEPRRHPALLVGNK